MTLDVMSNSPVFVDGSREEFNRRISQSSVRMSLTGVFSHATLQLAMIVLLVMFQIKSVIRYFSNTVTSDQVKKDLASVVQRLDNTTQWINQYPTDKC